MIRKHQLGLRALRNLSAFPLTANRWMRDVTHRIISISMWNVANDNLWLIILMIQFSQTAKHNSLCQVIHNSSSCLITKSTSNLLRVPNIKDLTARISVKIATVYPPQSFFVINALMMRCLCGGKSTLCRGLVAGRKTFSYYCQHEPLNVEHEHVT